jgi:hypothetical protein
MIGNFFGVAGMLFAGYMMHRGSVETLFIVFACSYCFAALCWLAVDVTRPLRIEHNRDVPNPEDATR